MINDITQNIRNLCQKIQKNAKKNTQKHVETQHLNNDKE